MSEAAPGYQDAPEFATAERAQLAGAVRVLVDAVMTTPDADPATLVAVAEKVDALAAELIGGEPGDRGPGYRPRSHGDYLPRSPVVGEASPLSPRLDWDVVDGRVHAHGVFTAAYEGPPGFVHGGIVALAFDEVLGIVNIANGSPGMTGTLSVKYRKPTPLYAEARFEAWVDRVEGRRIESRAELWVGETLCAEAEGIFIQPRPEVAQSYFGGQPDGQVPFAS